MESAGSFCGKIDRQNTAISAFGIRHVRVSSPPRFTGPPAYVEIDDVDRPSLSAPPRMGEQPYKMGRFSAATRVRRKRNPPAMVMDQAVAGPSHANHSPSVENLDEGTVKDITLLEWLMGGCGLTDHQWEGLFTMCEKCGQHFVRSKLSGHTKTCNGLIVLWVGYGDARSDNVPLENIQNIHNIECLQTLNVSSCIFLHSDKSYHTKWNRIATRLLKTEELCLSYFVQTCHLQNVGKVRNAVQFWHTGELLVCIVPQLLISWLTYHSNNSIITLLFCSGL